MANEELVARLKGSVDEWNQWREQNFVQSYDLSEANLSEANLSGANLSGADLRGANLSVAHLSVADLSVAYLNRANLSEADLSGADLRGADFRGVDFRGARLSGANLSGADLREVHLSGADLREVRLSGANLSGVHLREVHLSGADLSETNLSGANLSGAFLNRANLSGADLSETNLSETSLSGADLSGANLSGAYLSGAFLNRADLLRANLSKANFTQSIFDHTLFVKVDLSTVQGLETARHEGPSTVNINSVILPQDEPTRTHFLRGVGFTEQQIDYLPSLLTPRPIQYHSLFISYASQNKALAQRLHTDLRKKNVPCWFAPHDLRPGNYFRKHIDQAIHMQDKVLLLLSEHSVKSGWVEYEVELALTREISQKREIIFPVRLDDAIFSCTDEWAISLKNLRHIGDFTSWQEEQRYQEAFALLLHHLKTELSPPHNVL